MASSESPQLSALNSTERGTPAAAGAAAFRILHISDIHEGKDFQKPRWSNLRTVASKLRPDLIVLTGDLVNTPWRWMVSRSRQSLLEFSKAVGASKEVPCPLWVVAGNHDTRISGIFPIAWLLPAAGGSAAIGAFFWYLASVERTTQLSLVAALVSILCFAIALVSVGLRLVTVADLARAVGIPFFLQSAVVSECGRVGIVPLDSASADVSWARGKVSDTSLSEMDAQMRAAENKDTLDKNRLVWIALVHHHLLPLPYDSPSERGRR